MKYRWEFKTPSHETGVRGKPRLALIYNPRNEIMATAVDADTAQKVVDALNKEAGL